MRWCEVNGEMTDTIPVNWQFERVGLRRHRPTNLGRCQVPKYGNRAPWTGRMPRGNCPRCGAAPRRRIRPNSDSPQIPIPHSLRIRMQLPIGRGHGGLKSLSFQASFHLFQLFLNSLLDCIRLAELLDGFADLFQLLFQLLNVQLFHSDLLLFEVRE